MHWPYEYFKSINDTNRLDLEFVDFSLEISADINMGAAISRKLYYDYQKIVPVESLFGWNRTRLDPDILTLVDSYGDYFRDFERKLHVIDEETTPTLFHDVMMEVAKRNGTFAVEGRWISECKGYVSYNPNKIIIGLIDTVNLSEVEPTHETVKSSIDRISRIAVWFRNKCNMTFIVVQQFNSDISAVDRSRYGIKTPLLRDFEDSKRTTKDANIVYGLFDPLRHMRAEETVFYGYDISILKSWFRSAHLLKNRNGQASKFIPLKYDGAVGTFSQLPDAVEMTAEEYARATRH